MPELPEVQAWVEELAPEVSRSPIASARPEHIATLKTFDPPVAELVGKRFAGATRRGKNLLLPDEDGGAHAARTPDERRSTALHPAQREDAEDLDVPRPVRGRRRARAHRGGQAPPRRRLALSPRPARGRARLPRAGRARRRYQGAVGDPQARAPPAASTPSRSAGAHGDRSSARERDPLARQALPVPALAPSSTRRRPSACATRSTPISNGRSSFVARARATPTSTSSTVTSVSHAPSAATRCNASRSRSTRSPTAPRARPAVVC